MTIVEKNERDTQDRAVFEDLSKIENDYRQRQLRRILFENSSDAIVIADPKNCIMDVNEAFTRLTGYDKEQALGKPSGFMKSGRHSTTFYRQMWKALESEGAWEGEVWDRHKNGHIYPKSLKIEVVKSLQGDVSCYVGMFRDSSEQRNHDKQLQELAYYDPLTKLPNRRLLMERLEQRLIANDRNGSKTALLSIDVDKFKSVNDTYGHPTGDALLIEIARSLSAVIRASDTLGRISGDEFIILADVSRAEEDMAILASKLVVAMDKLADVDGKQLFASLSIGIAFYPDNASSASELISHADMAMYQAKRTNGNQYCFYDKSIGDHHRLQLDLANGLKNALRWSELFAHFQPIVRLRDLTVDSFEALARWSDAKRGDVRPDLFIPVAEESGMIDAVTEQVFHCSCDLLSHPKFPANAKIALNLSAQQLKSKSLVEWLESLVKQRQVLLTQFKIELTESTLIPDLEQVSENLLRLKQLGVEIALDDFGTGFSSLNHLKRFPLNFIKIDKSFIRELTEDKSSESYLIVKAIIRMAQSLRLEVVAEGVETSKQVDILRLLGCDLAQGYLFCRPKPWQDIMEEMSARA